MSKFLIKNDFLSLIKDENLDEVLSDDLLLNSAIDAAVEEAAGYIRHRYDESKTFAIVNIFDKTKAYLADDRIFWEEDAWLPTEIYNVDDLISFNDTIYSCLVTTVAGESPTTTPAKWQPEQLNKTYYTVTANTIVGDLPSDDSKFTLGDSRNFKLKDVVTDITLYNIHSRITPRSIPEVRAVRYDGNGSKEAGSALQYLRDVQKGTITPLLPVAVDGDGVAPQSGERITWGNSPDSNYSY